MKESMSLIKHIKEGEALGLWEYKEGIILYKGQIYLPLNSPLILAIVEEIHSSAHEGMEKTL